MKWGHGTCIFDGNYIELFCFLSSLCNIVKPKFSGPRWAPIKLISIKIRTKVTVFSSYTMHHKAELSFSGIGQECVTGVSIMILYVSLCKLKLKL